MRKFQIFVVLSIVLSAGPVLAQTTMLDFKRNNENAANTQNLRQNFDVQRRQFMIRNRNRGDLNRSSQRIKINSGDSVKTFERSNTNLVSPVNNVGNVSPRDARDKMRNMQVLQETQKRLQRDQMNTANNRIRDMQRRLKEMSRNSRR